MSMTVKEQEIHGRLWHALNVARGARMEALRSRDYADVRIHIGPAVLEWIKTLCLTEDSRLPPASRFGGFDLIHESDFEPDRIVVRADREIL
jgi:hypothetical protein